MPSTATTRPRTPLALYALTAGAFGIGRLGVAAFATVPPMQMWVLHKADGAQSLASSLNIGAFNLGNALGAWLGGMVIMHGPGLGAVTWVAALVTLSGLVIALWAVCPERRPGPVLAVACPQA